MAAGEDNLSCVAWLDGALEQAFRQRSPELWAYLEAVLEEVLFELEEVLFEMEAELLDRTRLAREASRALGP